MMSQDYWRCKNVKKLEVEYLEKVLFIILYF
jgi:hypothetical protein